MMSNWQKRYKPRSEWDMRYSSSEVPGDGKGQLDGISPSAFSDGEMLWADGKPMPHPEYNLDLGIRPEGPPLLTKDINKAVEPSTITAAMDKDTFFCGDGVMKVGDEFHPIKMDYRTEDDEERIRDGRHRFRGGYIKLPNGHEVSIAWGNMNYSDNYLRNVNSNNDINETPHEAEVAIITPDDRYINLDEPKNDISHVYGYQTTDQAKELIKRAKEL